VNFGSLPFVTKSDAFLRAQAEPPFAIAHWVFQPWRFIRKESPISPLRAAGIVQKKYFKIKAQNQPFLYT
jgi:hypothetical protein